MSKSSVKLKCQLWWLQHSCYRFGRRLAVVASCAPLVLGWLVTWQASQLGHLYIARSDQTRPLHLNLVELSTDLCNVSHHLEKAPIKGFLLVEIHYEDTSNH